jgi:hypothetical protein
MTLGQDPYLANPVAEKYATIAAQFLEARVGDTVTVNLIIALGTAMISTECEFVGLSEAVAELEVSNQRAAQVQERFGPIAGRTSAGHFWLKEQLLKYIELSAPRRQKYLGIPKRNRIR